MHRPWFIFAGLVSASTMMALPCFGQAQDWQHRASNRTIPHDMLKPLLELQSGQKNPPPPPIPNAGLLSVPHAIPGLDTSDADITAAPGNTPMNLPALAQSGGSVSPSHDDSNSAKAVASGSSAGTDNAVAPPSAAQGFFARIGAFFRRILRLFGMG